MKLLFVHDGTLKYDSEGRYFGTAVNPNTLSRYRYITNDITILIRTQPFKDGESKDKYTQIPKEYKIVHCPNYMSVKGMIFDKRKVKKKLQNMVKNSDLVVARFSGETGKMAAKISHREKIPYIIECVGCYWDSLWNYNFKGKLLAGYSYLSARKLIKRAQYVIYVTNEFLQKRYPTNGKSISASNVELEPIDKSYLEKRINKINNMKNHKEIILGTAGGIDVPFKGHAYVIEAISVLNKKGYNFKYQILGAGDKSRLVDISKKFNVEDSIEFLGVKPHSQVFEWLDNLDIYIQPSDQEGLPRALIEAMSRACPAIGSSTAGIPELLDKNFVFKRKKVNELIHLLEAMNKEKMVEQSKRNFDEAKKYQKEIIYKRRNDFFDMVVR